MPTHEEIDERTKLAMEGKTKTPNTRVKGSPSLLKRMVNKAKGR